MKSPKWLSILTVTLLTFSMWSCQDWGQMDPPAGNQIYPRLELKGEYKFEDELSPEEFTLSAYGEGNIPEIVSDSEKGNVLQLNGGFARVSNPLLNVKIQTGASVTFWVKTTANNLSATIFSFMDEEEQTKLFFTPNAWLKYQGAGASFEVNNPSQPTDALTADEWHYVALSVKTDGFFIYIDGEKAYEQTADGSFDFNEIVNNITTLPYFYLGYGSGSDAQQMWVDDVRVYRNVVTDKETALPSLDEVEEDNSIIIGSEDCTTPWWSAFSDLVTATGDKTIHFGFYNYTNGNANWNNWLLVVTNGKDRGEAGYAEHFVLRSDAWGWGDAGFSVENMTHDFNFDTFTSDMNGAYVDLTIKRSGSTLNVTAIVTTEDKKTYTYKVTYDGDLGESIGAFLTCEGAYLKIDPETVYSGDAYDAGTYLVGPADCTAPWWTYRSELSVISGNTPAPFVYTFINNTNATANWNNWLLVMTNGKMFGEDDYAEYFVLRADAWGWGDGNYNGEAISSGYDWDNYVKQMQGAHCKVILTRSGNRLNMTAKVTTADGTKLPDYTFYYEGISTPEIGLFLTVELASLDVRTVAYYPYLTTSN